ncbi:Dihydrolipoyllysine-residue succinyltransferase component of 2-oxoglutarate dehydrogenase complex 2 [Nymphaea thermarum]|nr:Dihydrolipoyllysine-residue succinyltransferase component of 2-oxoglutarate dehydrogenase complex 2 [Nymphaea thermarum]
MLEHLVRKVGRSGSFSTISALVHGTYLHRTVAEWPVLHESTGAERLRLVVVMQGDLVDAVVPFMGESITDGTLATFLKKPGDKVEVDETIAQIETDKVTIDVASPEAGIIQRFVAKEGDTVVPGTKVAIISKSGIADSDAPASKEKSIEEVRLPSSSTDGQKVEKSKPVEAVVRDKPRRACS